MSVRSVPILMMTFALPGALLAQATATTKANPAPRPAHSQLLVMPHTHTYDMRVVIISGTYIQSPDGKPEFRLGPGSYFLQPGGEYRHTTTCDKASDCVFLVESAGPFDLKLVDAVKVPAN